MRAAIEGLTGPKGELLCLLEKLRDRMGLTDAVVRSLVDEAEITYPGGRFLPLVTCSQRSQNLRFVIQGVAKIVCDVTHFGHVIVDLVGKGEFLCLPPLTPADPFGRVEAVVHEGPIVLALIPRNVVSRAIATLPPSGPGRLVSWSWRGATRLAYAKTALLPLPTSRRLIRELARLAERFGHPQDDGRTLIRVRLLQDDLAALIVRSRSNVSRAFAKLQKDGLVDRVGNHLLIATSLVRTGGSMPAPGDTRGSAGGIPHPPTGCVGEHSEPTIGVSRVTSER